MKQKNFLLLLILTLLLACSKDDADSLSSNFEDAPAFYVRGVFNGDSLEYTAGENNFQLSTDYVLGVDSLLILRGKMERTDSSSDEALSIWIRTNTRLETNGLNLNVNQELSPQLYPYSTLNNLTARPGEFTISTTATTAATNHSWSSAQGSASGSSATFNVQNVSNPFLVTLNSDFLGGCTNQVTHFINPSLSCDATFSVNWLADNSIECIVSARNSSSSITSVKWFLDNNEVQLSASNTLALSYGANQTLKAEITFADGCTKTVSRQFSPVTGIVPLCETDFTYQASPVTQTNPTQMGTVEIIYTNAQGVRYSSRHSSLNGTFELLSASDYQRNEQGNATKRFTFVADAVLKDASGNEIKVHKLFGNFAVAYPD